MASRIFSRSVGMVIGTSTSTSKAQTMSADARISRCTCLLETEVADGTRNAKGMGPRSPRLAF